MSARGLVVDLLVGLGVGTELLCCVGLLATRTVFDRLHFAGAASSLPPLLVAAAVLVAEGFTAPGINAAIVALSLLVLNAVLVSATARAARIAQSRP